MAKLISFMHISLDGFVCGPDGEMDWIHVDEEIFDFVGKRVAQTEAAVYGRTTFEMMEGYWPTAAQNPGASQHDLEHSAWYMGVSKIVISGSLSPVQYPHATLIGVDIKGRISEIKAKSDKEILVFGSPRATQTLIQEGLIDGYWLFVNPVVLGKGVRLFEGAPSAKLNLVSTHTFGSGVVELNYQ